MKVHLDINEQMGLQGAGCVCNPSFCHNQWSRNHTVASNNFPLSGSILFYFIYLSFSFSAINLKFPCLFICALNGFQWLFSVRVVFHQVINDNFHNISEILSAALLTHRACWIYSFNFHFNLIPFFGSAVLVSSSGKGWTWSESQRSVRSICEHIEPTLILSVWCEKRQSEVLCQSSPVWIWNNQLQCPLEGCKWLFLIHSSSHMSMYGVEPASWALLRKETVVFM